MAAELADNADSRLAAAVTDELLADQLLADEAELGADSQQARQTSRLTSMIEVLHRDTIFTLRKVRQYPEHFMASCTDAPHSASCTYAPHSFHAH